MSEKSTNASPPRAVILTAIPVEYDAVKRHLINLEEITHPKGNVYEKGIFKGEYSNWEVGIAEVGAGNNTCALQTERAISYFNPEVVLFVGIAGGIKDLNLGDVVAAEKAYGYESGKVNTSKFQTRPTVGLSSYEIFERAKAEAKKDSWKERLPKKDQKKRIRAITKPIAAGEKVIVSKRSEVYKLLISTYNDTVAVEMEGYGFYTACHANGNLQFLIVRGISDLLKNKSATDAKGYQQIAARNASAFAFQVLSRFKIR